jgi:hypothetical protein
MLPEMYRVGMYSGKVNRKSRVQEEPIRYHAFPTTWFRGKSRRK